MENEIKYKNPVADAWLTAARLLKKHGKHNRKSMIVWFQQIAASEEFTGTKYDCHSGSSEIGCEEHKMKKGLHCRVHGGDERLNKGD